MEQLSLLIGKVTAFELMGNGCELNWVAYLQPLLSAAFFHHHHCRRPSFPDLLPSFQFHFEIFGGDDFRSRKRVRSRGGGKFRRCRRWLVAGKRKWGVRMNHGWWLWHHEKGKRRGGDRGGVWLLEREEKAGLGLVLPLLPVVAVEAMVAVATVEVRKRGGAMEEGKRCRRLGGKERISKVQI